MGTPFGQERHRDGRSLPLHSCSMVLIASRHDVTFVTTCELLPKLETHAALSRLHSEDASTRSESIEGFGSEEGGSLAGYESANVLSIIFSRMAAMSPDATQRSSGSRALSATISS